MIIKVIEKLLKEGRGFDFQSHGERCGEVFYNFALYPINGTKGSTHYIHGFDTDVIAKEVKELMSDGPLKTVPPMPKMKPLTPVMPLPRM